MAASPPHPTTRRIWQWTSTTGGLENNLKLNHTPIPTPKPTEHLVRILASALNPVDYKPAEIGFIGRFFVRKPATPGIDIVGRIVVPAQGSGLARGQLVFGGASENVFAGGGLTEYAAVPSKLLIPVPEGVDPVDAASVPIGGLTAYQALVPYAKAGDRVFINGGSGGVGLFAIQIAKALGCWVTTTCSTKNVELCRAVGADEVVDYSVTSDLVGALGKKEKFALVMENVGTDDDLYWRCHEFVAPGGKFVVVGREVGLETLKFVTKALIVPGFLGGGQRKIVFFQAVSNREHLEQIGKWMQEGKVKAQIDSRFPFEQVPDAFRKLKTHRARGKIIIDIAAVEAEAA